MSHEQVYLGVSAVIITAFILYQLLYFRAWGWEAYVGLSLSLSGCLVALIKSVS